MNNFFDDVRRAYAERELLTEEGFHSYCDEILAAAADGQQSIFLEAHTERWRHGIDAETALSALVVKLSAHGLTAELVAHPEQRGSRLTVLVSGWAKDQR